MKSVMTFYRFVRLSDLPAWRDALQAEAAAQALCGTILLADEGINATLAGERPALERFRQGLEARPELAGLPCRFSAAVPGNVVFDRLKVRIRPEIVRLDQPGVAPNARTGEHVDARRWNALLDDPDVVVIDTRNRYETAVGSFPGAMDPGTRSFRQFPAFVRGHLDPARHRRVAMFCTGGVRCEKASAWMLAEGFETVYQLDGGILSYLETVPHGESRWQGECFVFDQRVSVPCGPGGTGAGRITRDATPSTHATGGPAMHPDELDSDQRRTVEAAVFRRLLAHLDERKDVQNIELMNLAGFCRNCLAKWYAAACADAGIEVDYEDAREHVYGMPYADWKLRHQREASAEQLSRLQRTAE